MADAKRTRRAAQRRALRRVFAYIRRCRGLLVLSLLLAAATVGLTLYVPILLGRAIDAMVGAGQVDLEKIVRLLVLSGILVAVTAALKWVMNTVNNALTYRIVRDMRRDAFHHIQRLPLSYLDAHPSGEIVSRVIADVDQFADGLLMGSAQLFTGIMTIVGTLAFMLSIHPGITAVVVVLTPLSLLLASFIARRTFSMFREQSVTRGEQTAFVDEAIGGQKLAKAFGREAEHCRRFDEINDRLERCSMRATFFSSLVNPTTRLINNLIYAGVGMAGALAAIGGGLTVGGLSCFLSYAGQYAKPFNEISGVITELQNALACADRVFELLEQPAQPADAPRVLPLPQGNVALEDVSFSYTPERPLIDGLSLTVRPGQRIAVVGPTGCGKTTLINLLMRFYDVNGGRICVEGEDIRTVSRDSLRAGYGMVLQETWLKHGTVRENLLFGRPDATDGEMIAAAKDAHADSFIRRLPQGYDTVISADGGELSAGQRQLLCIARVMLCQPPMLILDEATSSIDARTELKIQAAFDRLMRGRTTFIVAHRLSTIREADVILVMRDGHIVEQGDHETLLAADGFYAKLYNSQFAG